MEKIVIKASVNSPLEKVWEFYTKPDHIVNWNFADPSWHCPSARNDLKVGGDYSARMEAKDGSFGFDFDATYTEVKPLKSFTYEFGGRRSTVTFEKAGEQTNVVVSFDPESENPIEMQRDGWQAILNNFKDYTENH